MSTNPNKTPAMSVLVVRDDQPMRGPARAVGKADIVITDRGRIVKAKFNVTGSHVDDHPRSNAVKFRPLDLAPLDLANLLHDALEKGANGVKWEDYDCTVLGAYHSVAAACGIPAEYYAGTKPVENAEAATTRTIGVDLTIGVDPALGPDKTVQIVVMTQDEYECLAGEVERKDKALRDEINALKEKAGNANRAGQMVLAGEYRALASTLGSALSVREG